MNSIVRYLARVAASAGLYGLNLLEHTEVRKNCVFFSISFPLLSVTKVSTFFFLLEDLFYIPAFYCVLLVHFIISLRFLLCRMLSCLYFLFCFC